MADNQAAAKPILEMTDEELLAAVAARYRGQMDTLDFTKPDERAQLALDLGLLIGMCGRLLTERERRG